MAEVPIESFIYNTIFEDNEYGKEVEHTSDAEKWEVDTNQGHMR